MVRQRGSKENATRNKPRHAFSLTTFGAITKGGDKNAPPKDCPYLVFGKRLQRSIMGFGSIAAAIYAGNMITDAILKESHGISKPGKKDMNYFHERLKHHRTGLTVQFQTMNRAAQALLKAFPGIEHDIACAGERPQRLIKKIRNIMHGAHAARHTDVCNIRNHIFVLSHNDAKKRGWSMSIEIDKGSRGIKSSETARFLLPFDERKKYLEDPDAYREQVERGQIKISLTNTWPAILYDESMVDDCEFSGLFRSETLLRCGITVLHGPSAGKAWKYPEPGARSFAASQKEGNAEINGITKISPEVIAYISTLAVFAVHDSMFYNRYIGGIDLSELYHDVVAALRTKTEWAVKTLEFWDNIFFGDAEEEVPEPGISREDRFKKLEAQQREREGLQPVGTNTSGPPASHAEHHQGNQDTGNSPPGSPALSTASKSQASPVRSGRGQKRKSPEGLSSDSSSDSDSDSDPVPVDPVPVDLTPKPRKRIQKKYGSTDSDKAVPVSPQPAASTSKKQQAIQMVPPPAQEIDVYEWEHSIRDLIKKLSLWAKAVDRNDTHEEFTKMLNMKPEVATQVYNRNYDRIERWRKEIEEAYRMGVEEDDPTAQNDDVLLLVDCSESASTSKPRPNPTKKEPKPKKPAAKKVKTPRGSAEVMPPPRRTTRSTAAKPSRQIKEDPIVDDNEPLTDIDDLDAPVTSTKSRKGKTPATARVRR